MNYIRPRPQDTRQSVLRPIERPYVPDLSPIPEWASTPRTPNARTDMSWLRTFVAPPAGWEPEIDQKGHSGPWEWCISSVPYTDMLRVIAARIWFKARAAMVANVPEAMLWIEALPG